MLKRLKTICILENLSYTEKGLKMAITLSRNKKFKSIKKNILIYSIILFFSNLVSVVQTIPTGLLKAK